MGIKKSPRLYVGLILVCALAGLLVERSGILAKSQAAAPPPPVSVKAMQVQQKDTPINYEFVGKITSKNEVKIMSKVSGNIVAKMVKGGDTVYKGQPLFRIDNRQYLSTVNSAKATLAKSQAALKNTQRDVDRYKKLLENGAVAQQTLDTYESRAEEEEAAAEANRADLQKAVADEQDTLILSPVDGRIDVNDISLGQYVAAGATTMATVSSVDPIWVQFSMSENEYIKLARAGQGSLPKQFMENLKLILSDDSEYPLLGKMEQIDKGIGDTTGTIVMKASFDNPQKLLIPGMFAKIVAPGEIRKSAVLIPQRAVKEVLDETFVIVIGQDNKGESRKVKMGARVGNMWVVDEGLNAGEAIVVEGIDKVKPGSMLKVEMIGPDDLRTPAKQ